MEWRARTGFSLASYKEKWESLKPLEKGVAGASSKSTLSKLADSVNLSTPDAEYRLKRLAYEYMHSYPGDDAAAKNHAVHSDCNTLLRNEELSSREREVLASSL